MLYDTPLDVLVTRYHVRKELEALDVEHRAGVVTTEDRDRRVNELLDRLSS